MTSEGGRGYPSTSLQSHGAGTQLAKNGDGNQSYTQTNHYYQGPIHTVTSGAVTPGIPTLGGMELNRNWSKSPNIQTIRDWFVDQAAGEHARTKAYHEESLGKLLNDTGKWIFGCKEYVSWKAGEECQFLGLHGILGSGKTLLLSLVAETIWQEIQAHQSLNVACVYFYFPKKGKEEQRQGSIDHLWATLLIQLLDSGRDRALATSLTDSFNDSLRDSSSASVAKLADLFKSQAETYQTVYLIIDSLDSLREDTLRETMQKALKGLPPKIRVLFTTDSSWLELNLGQKLDIEIKPQCEDIEAYVRHRIDNAPERKPHLKEAEEDVVETVTSIACKSKIFLLAELHMNLLSKQSTRAEISEALRQLPNHTEEVFEPSVQRLLILENKTDEKSRLTWRWAKHVLTWLVHGRPGLTADQIRDGFAISQSQGGDYESYRPSIDDLVSSCDGLVAKKSDEQSRILCLVHESVKDLLFERKVLLPKPTGDMASICLKFLCIPTSDAHEEQPPLLEYAARYWGHHLDLTPREDIGKVEADAMKFLQDSASLERSFLSLHPTKKQSFEGISGLHALVYFNLPYWAKRLISKSGVYVNMESSNGQTPLHWAVRYGHLQLVQVLLRNSADPNKYDNKQQTPLHEALIKPVANDDANIARELVKYGARSELKNSRGYSAMTFAIKYGPTSIAKVLIESQKVSDWKSNSTSQQRRGHPSIV